MKNAHLRRALILVADVPYRYDSLLEFRAPCIWAFLISLTAGSFTSTWIFQNIKKRRLFAGAFFLPSGLVQAKATAERG